MVGIKSEPRYYVQTKVARTTINKLTPSVNDDLCVADASLTNEPVRFDGDELPQSWTLRK